MNYSYHYDKLINRSPKIKPIDGYYEKHHIIPCCFCKDINCPGFTKNRNRRKHTCGLDDESNLVYLKPEEHYVAHQLLVKIYPKHHGLIKAACMMTVSSSNKRITNKSYGWLKRKFSESMKGENNFSKNSQVKEKIAKTRAQRKHLYKKRYISDEERKNMRERMIKNNPMNNPEHRKTMGKSKIGNKNTLGLMYITNGKERRKIPLNSIIPEGFIKGYKFPV